MRSLKFEFTRQAAQGASRARTEFPSWTAWVSELLLVQLDSRASLPTSCSASTGALLASTLLLHTPSGLQRPMSNTPLKLCWMCVRVYAWPSWQVWIGKTFLHTHLHILPIPLDMKHDSSQIYLLFTRGLLHMHIVFKYSVQRGRGIPCANCKSLPSNICWVEQVRNDFKFFFGLSGFWFSIVCGLLSFAP